MALVSMTGYGQAADPGGLGVDVRTVNHRHLDVACRLPRPWGALEAEVKAAVGARIRRGRVDLSVRPAPGTEGGGFTLDRERAAAYLEAARTLADGAGVAGTVDLAGLLALPGVVVPEEAPADVDALRARVLATVELALEAAVAMRREEGAALEKAIRGHLAAVGSALARIEGRHPQARAEAAARAVERVRALCAQVPAEAALDEARLAQELAFLAERGDISEELARLRSHVEQFTRALDATEAVGRTLDFLLIEMNREANTIGAKCQDAALAAEVVTLKGEIEKVREQVQNVE